MFKLKLLLLTKGIYGVNEFLDKNPRYLERLNENQFNEFVRLYFDIPFVLDNNDVLHIFDFIWNYDNFDEEILLQSKYFQTITGGSILIALNSLSDCEFYVDKLAKYLIYKLDAKQLLNYSIADLTHLIFYFSNMGLEEKLLECKNIDIVSAISNEIDYDFEVLFNKKIISKLSLTEFREYCLKGNIRVLDIFKYLELHLKKNREVALDALFDIFMNRKKVVEYAISETPIINDFFKKIAELEMFEEQDKEYLAFKLLASKNYDKMLEWLYYIDCPINYQMIDELVQRGYIINLIKSVHEKKYLEYSIKKILEQNAMDQNFSFVLNMFLSNNNPISKEELNRILNILFSLKQDFSITKQNAIKLMKKGVDIFPILIERYLLNAEEREEILVSLKEANRFDLCTIYGSYLLSGNNSQLLNEQVIKREDALIRSLKPKKM